MTFKLLDVVVLNKDEPEHGLKRGDLGTIVDVYERDAVEVEFVTAVGGTEAVVTLKPSDLRGVHRTDLLAVRSFTGAA